ncbi:hypothetical protein B7P43_G14180 [Cryptotermes secundus]|uniref:Uncharacterized protein n=2 Tax=Cryptotermes secundus TaxID=105785 RepID=A0A2J7RPF3_9NEOP|nr:hypothetical protein B7P43_G14180 [Cryptotermes secundus]PNF42712.1 hypothetical protein B7P43_G14180 [Cryptotermes secundus]
MFELIYRQHAPQAPPYLGMNLSIRGTKVRNTVSRPRSQTRSANKANIPRDRSNEQESYSSSPDNSKKRKSVMLQSSFSRRPTVTSSSGSSGDNRCQDCPEKFAIQSIPGISFEGEALFSEQSRQPTSKESIMETHSGDGSDEQNLVSSDSEYTVNPNYSTNNAQLNNLQEYINSEPEYKLDINHSSEQLKFLDTNLETILDKNPDIHSKNSIDVASYDNEGNHKHETGLNSSSAISAEQELPSSPPECVTKNTARLKDYEMNQPIDSSPENKLQVKEAGIKKSEGSSNEVQPVSNGHELNMVKWRSIRVTNFKLARTEHEAVSSGPENSTQKNRTEIIKKTGSTSKEQEPVTSGLEQTVSRKSRLKFRKKNQGGSGTEMTMRKKNNCKVQKMSDSSDDQHSVNSGSFQKKKSTKIKNSSDSSEEQKSRCDYNRDRKKSATIKPMRQRCEGQQLFDSDTENVTQKKTSSGTKDTCDSSDEQELISSGYDNKAHLNYSKIKCLRENSEYQELSTKPESPSQKKRKNLGGNISSDGSGIQEQCKRTKQSLNKSIEEDEVSTFSDIQKKSKETDKSQGSDGESEEVAVHATPKHKKAMPNTMSLYGSSIVDHGKGSQAQKGTHTSLLHGGMTEMQGKDVMDAQECEEIFKNATAVMQGKAECTAAKTAGKSWSHTKEGFSISHFTETIYSNAEEIIPKGKKCYSSGWKNSSDAEKSMEYFNEWRQKLDHTKASCEDMLAKFKTVRDNENIIHTPKYYSIDKGINWEGESANKPTISDIIKKLSQTRPEREFFTCNTGRKFIDIIPEHALSKKKEKIKTHQYDLSMVDEDNMNSTAKTNRRLCSGPSDQRLSLTTHVYHPSVNRNPISIAILPHIRQRIKQPSDNNLFCSGRKVDSFYAVSMNLKTLQASQNIRQHLLLPLGSDQCLGVNSTIPAAIEGSLL